MIADRRA